MRFGLALPHYDFSLPEPGPVRWNSVVEWAVHAEALGFHSVWLSDHLFYDLARYGGPQGVQKGVECFTGLAALSAATSTVRLGTLVVCNDFRHPALLAKMVATLDVLSGGRVDLGMGAGWFQAEYLEAGIPFDPPGVRIERLSEALRIVRGLLDRGECSFEGRYYRLEGARCLPRPAQEHLPVFVGGHGDRLARLAGRHADGFNTAWSCRSEELEEKFEVVDRAAERAGRNPAEVKRSVGLYCLPGLTDDQLQQRWRRYVECGPPGRPDHRSFALWASDKLTGTPEQMETTIRRFEDLGVEEIILTFGSIPFQICDAGAVDQFMVKIASLII